MFRVCLDPAHGGRDPGATGPTGLQEKNVSLAVCKIIADLLTPFVIVRLTRDKDVALGPDLNSDLAARVKIANEFNAKVFVSVHCNSAENDMAHGMEVYTTPGQGPSDELAEKIVRGWVNAFPGMVIRRDLSDGDSDKEANFYVLRKTNMSAVLIEMAFISNPEEEKLLASNAFQTKAALVIAEAIASHLGVCLHPQPSLPETPGITPVEIHVRGQTYMMGIMIVDHVYVPVRAFAELLGHKVDWRREAVWVE